MELFAIENMFLMRGLIEVTYPRPSERDIFQMKGDCCAPLSGILLQDSIVAFPRGVHVEVRSAIRYPKAFDIIFLAGHFQWI